MSQAAWASDHRNHFKDAERLLVQDDLVFPCTARLHPTHYLMGKQRDHKLHVGQLAEALQCHRAPVSRCARYTQLCTTGSQLLGHIWENGSRKSSPVPGRALCPCLWGTWYLSSIGAILPFASPLSSCCCSRGWGQWHSFLFLTALGKKRILKGFEHSSLNSSLKLRGFTADYGKRPPAASGRRRQVLGSRGAEERQESCGWEQDQRSRICPRTCWGQKEQGGGHQQPLVDGTEQPLLGTGHRGVGWANGAGPIPALSPGRGGECGGGGKAVLALWEERGWKCCGRVSATKAELG